MKNPTVELPLEIYDIMSAYVDNPTLGRLSFTCLRLHGLFAHQLTARHIHRATLNANPATIEPLLKKWRSLNPKASFITTRFSGKEENGRIWKSVSALEYAAWAGDDHLVNLLLNYLPDEHLQKALAQLIKLKMKGTEHGFHLAAIRSLITAYDTCIAKFDHWDAATREYHWVQVIGTRQRELPLYGLQRFCDEEPFYPLTAKSFLKEPRRSCFLLPFNVSGLSTRLAVFKIAGEVEREHLEPRASIIAREAFSRLCELSTKALDNWISQLTQRIQSSHQTEIPYCN